MQVIIGLAVLVSFATMVAGLVMLLPFKLFTPKRYIAVRIAIGGLAVFLFASIILPKSPSTNDSSLAAPTGAPSSILSEQVADIPSSDAVKALPNPNFARRDGNIYYYVVGSSADDLNEGHAAKEILGFKYLGSPYHDGLNYVMQVDSRGLNMGVFSCADPCSIIKEGGGRMVDYDPASVIGSVFQDLANGYLGRPIYRPGAISDQTFTRPHAIRQSSIYQQDTTPQPGADQADGQ